MEEEITDEIAEIADKDDEIAEFDENYYNSHDTFEEFFSSIIGYADTKQSENTVMRAAEFDEEIAIFSENERENITILDYEKENNSD